MDEGVGRRLVAAQEVVRAQQGQGDVRAVEAELETPLAVMVDLCGPKIRVGSIVGGEVPLVEGAKIVIQPFCSAPCQEKWYFVPGGANHPGLLSRRGRM